MNGSLDEVARALVPQASVTHKSFRHLARFESVRKIGELVDNNLRPDIGHDASKRVSVEDVHYDRFDPHLTQHLRLVGGPGGADHLPSVSDQEWREPPADGARCAREEEALGHVWTPDF
jgi:hypothetical protein